MPVCPGSPVDNNSVFASFPVGDPTSGSATTTRRGGCGTVIPHRPTSIILKPVIKFRLLCGVTVRQGSTEMAPILQRPRVVHATARNPQRPCKLAWRVMHERQDQRWRGSRAMGARMMRAEPSRAQSARAECVCEAQPACSVCLESEGELTRRCACRGTAGYIHVECIAAYSAYHQRHHTCCPPCKVRPPGAVLEAAAEDRLW